jgi:hypothetical protein
MIQLLIVVDDQGRLTVNGPIKNKIMTLGLLEAAKETVIEFHRENAQRVQPPTAEDMALIREN